MSLRRQAQVDIRTWVDTEDVIPPHAGGGVGDGMHVGVELHGAQRVHRSAVVLRPVVLEVALRRDRERKRERDEEACGFKTPPPQKESTTKLQTKLVLGQLACMYGRMDTCVDAVFFNFLQ